jgi:hypothetical protein
MNKEITVEYIESKVRANEPMFKEVFDKYKCAYAILQLPIECDYKFNDLHTAIKRIGRMPSRNDYQLVYASEIDPNGVGLMSSRDLAETVFMKFNAPNRPGFDEDYYGTSVGISDVIVIKCGYITFAFYIDTMGFERIVNFEV